MTENSRKTSADYLETLEQVKKQYRQYIEVSGLYELPIQKSCNISLPARSIL